jgi:hypothetical protein
MLPPKMANKRDPIKNPPTAESTFCLESNSIAKIDGLNITNTKMLAEISKPINNPTTDPNFAPRLAFESNMLSFDRLLMGSVMALTFQSGIPPSQD